jgi:hypothetical protein
LNICLATLKSISTLAMHLNLQWRMYDNFIKNIAPDDEKL